MRHVTILLAVMVITLCGQRMAYGEDSNDEIVSKLTDEQRREYNHAKLSVEVEGVSFGSYGSGLWSGSSWRRWTAFSGFDRLTEEQFFRTAGYESEAQKARAYKSSNDGMTAIGAVLAIGGSVAMVIGATKTTTTHYDYGYGISGDIKESDPDEGLMYGGIIAATVGTALLYAGIIGGSRNWAPYAVVEGITSEYNHKILVGMKKNL